MIFDDNPDRNMFHIRRKLFAVTDHRPEALEDILGSEWYFLHEADCVGVVKKVSLCLWRHTINEYKTDEMPNIIPGSLVTQTATYMHMSFTMENIIRAPDYDREGLNWKQRAKGIIEDEYTTC